MPKITPPAGWQNLTAQGFEIWLPQSYVGGTDQDFESAINRLSELGAEFEEMARSLESNRSLIVLFALDQITGSSGVITNVIVGKEIVPESRSMESYLDSYANNLPDQYRIIQKEALPDARYPTMKLVTEISAPEIGNLTQILYGIKYGGAVWQIVFSTAVDEFETRSLEFEEIVKTVTVPDSVDNPNWFGDNYQGIILLFGFTILVAGVSLYNLWLRKRTPLD